jgi:hypothetical protein
MAARITQQQLVEARMEKLHNIGQLCHDTKPIACNSHHLSPEPLQSHMPMLAMRMIQKQEESI